MAGSSNLQEPCLATVTNVCGTNPNRYAVTVVKDRYGNTEIVTFTLNSRVWSETDDPVPGEQVELGGFVTARQGIRAKSARRLLA
jgi:hypothetical protein